MPHTPSTFNIFRSKVARLLNRSAQKELHSSVLALMDQTLVSGTNFATTVLIGRLCGAEELGVYTLGFTLIILFNVILESMIATPYTIYASRLDNEAHARYAGSVLIHSLVLAGLVMVFLLLVGSLNHWLWPDTPVSGILMMIGAVIGFEIMRQFARRFAFAELRIKSALAIDAVVAAVHLSGLALLSISGYLNAFYALGFIGAGGATAFIAWFVRNRRVFVYSLQDSWLDLRKNFQLGGWVFAGRILSAVNNNLMHWLLAFFLGTMATGIFSACMTVVMFSNPLFLGISNLMGPRVATAYSQGGTRDVRSVIWQSILWLSAILSGFCIVLFFYGETILLLLYKGEEYLNLGSIIIILGFHVLVSGISMPLYHGLVVIERADINLKINALAMVITLSTALVLLPVMGIIAAAISLLLSNVITTIIQGVVFLRLISREETELELKTA